MHSTVKIGSPVLRGLQLLFAVVVSSILGWFLHRLQQYGVFPGDNGRLVYAVAVGALSIVFSLAQMVPRSFTFTLWPADAVFSLLWLVAFALMTNVSTA
jgi:UDP-N-acetylmuramyl pentapeptide phosphotransferase/UDP-N-acetylglucosamine-1-phosphate transferase